MVRPRYALLLGAAAAAAGCVHVTARPREPSAPSQGALVLAATLRQGRFQKLSARSATLVRVGDNGELDDQPIFSNFRSHEQVYFLDLPPGRYAPLEASFWDMGARSSVRLEPAAAKAWSVELPPGEVLFAGALQFRATKESRAVTTTRLLNVDKSRETAISIFGNARRALRGTFWQKTLDETAAELGPSRAPVRAPGWKKTLPEKPGERFTYVDVLKWNERRIAGGLEWREPADHARIAAVFLSPGMKGHKTKEEYLKDLRNTGSSEDSHIVSEVVFSSRAAYTARYTTYYYPEGTLVGSLVKVYVTEELVVPDPAGIYLIIFRAERRHFSRFYPRFLRFRDHIVLSEFAPPSNSLIWP